MPLEALTAVELDRSASHDTLGGRLYRDSTLYKGGKHLRDLSKLNRDLSKVLFITADPDAFQMHPDNTIKVHPPPAPPAWLACSFSASTLC